MKFFRLNALVLTRITLRYGLGRVMNGWRSSPAGLRYGSVSAEWYAITLRAKLSGAVYCYRSCLCVGVWLCLWVCYHDNSKLRASIFTKLGLWVNVVTICSWLNFGRPAFTERGVCGRANIFGSALLQPARSVCVSSVRYFHCNVTGWC